VRSKVGSPDVSPDDASVNASPFRSPVQPLNDCELWLAARGARAG
jgi:hypothetical protein